MMRWAWLLCAALCALAPAATAAPRSYEELRRAVKVLEAESKWRDAIPLLEEMERLVLREHGDRSAQLVDAQFQLGEYHMLAGNHDKAIAQLERTISTLERKPDAHPAQVSQILKRISDYHGHASRQVEQREVLARAVARLEPLSFADRDLFLSEMLAHLAVADLQFGNIDDALAHAERSVTLVDGVKDTPRAPMRILPLHVLGNAEHHAWRFEPALAHFEEALELASKHLGDGHTMTAELANETGAVYSRMGDTRRSVQLLDRALRIRLALHGAESAEVAATLVNLSIEWRSRGDHARALELAQRALAAYQKARGAEDVHASYAYLALGDTQRVLERVDDADASYRAALAIRERALGSDHPEVALVVERLAAVALDRGELDAAADLSARAVAIRGRVDGPRAASRSFALELGALVAMARRDGRAALGPLEEVLALRVAALGERNPNVAVTRCNLAVAHWLAGDRAASLEQQARCDEVREQLTIDALGAGNDMQKRGYLEALEVATRQAVDLHLSAFPDDERAAGLALTAILRRKGRALDVMTHQLRAAREADAKQAPIYAKLVAARASMAALLYAGADRERVDQARRDAAAYEQMLAEDSTLRFESASLDAVRSALPADAALIELSLFGKGELTATLPDPVRLNYAAYVLRRDTPPRGIVLGPRATIDAAIDALRQALSDPQRDPKPAARKLHDLLIAPIEGMLGDSPRWLISPDGAASLLPFGALVGKDGRYLVESRHISYLTSGRDLLREAGKGHTLGKPVLVGAPAFGTPRDDGAKLSFSALPGTAEEIALVEETLGAANTLTGEAANEAAVKALRNPEILHLATHGFFISDAVGAPSRGERAAQLALLPEASRADPWLASGLALAGANARSGGEDGLLSAYEAATLDLDGTKLVVLSACETGLGDATRGEGVLGLRRALVLAGAETVVMSLWRVDDGATRDLMRAYYTGLAGGAGRADGMRDAQLGLLSDPATAHPFHWAAFIVAGDPSPIHVDAGPYGEVRGARGCGCEVAPRSEVPWLALFGFGVLALRRRTALRSNARSLSAAPASPMNRWRGSGSRPVGPLSSVG